MDRIGRSGFLLEGVSMISPEKRRELSIAIAVGGLAAVLAGALIYLFAQNPNRVVPGQPPVSAPSGQ
jgi:hypothetical protein